MPLVINIVALQSNFNDVLETLKKSQPFFVRCLKVCVDEFNEVYIHVCVCMCVYVYVCV